MRSYLCVALTVLVLAADHTLASDTPSDTAGTPPMITFLKVSKEIITENLIANLPEEPAPSAQNKTTAIFVDFNKAKTFDIVPPFTFDDNPNLEWQRFNGSLPIGTVGIWNSYTDRHDYVCRTLDGCETGFYHSGYGDYCFFPHYPKFGRTNGFFILVNKDEFVNLEWKSGSFGSVPENSVRTCIRSEKDYVGKNKYGLGLVSAGDSFYLPWLDKISDDKFNGYTPWFRLTYQVLTINTDKYKQVIQEVKYNIDPNDVIETLPFAVDRHTVSNKQCNSATMTVTLSATQTKTNTWDFSYSMKLAISTSVTVGIPEIVSDTVTIGMEKTFQMTQGLSISESQTTSSQVEIAVPPNMMCTVKMQGRKFTSDIPFKARLGRTYSNGDTKWTTISGTYKGGQVSHYDAVIERCEPLADPLPCGK